MIEDYVNTEELKRLLSTLAVVVVALMIAALFATILVPGLRNANKPAAPMPVNPVIGEPGWLDPVEYPEARGKVIPPLDPKDLMSATSELTGRGKELFAQNCTACHGEKGLGNGPAAWGMNPQPRNFTSAIGWKNGFDLPAIYKTLSEGVRGTSMAPFDYLSKRDRMALAHFIQSLGAFPYTAGSDEAVAELAIKLSAAGETTPNKIPVSRAIAILQREYSEPARLGISPDDRSVEILRRVIVDPARAAQTLSLSESWRSSPKELAEAIVAGAPANGFSVNTALLGAGEWQALQTELIQQIPKKDAK